MLFRRFITERLYDQLIILINSKYLYYSKAFTYYYQAKCIVYQSEFIKVQLYVS